jgi:hypothetical protein
MHRLIFFRLLRTGGMHHSFPLRLQITAPELEEPFDEYFTVDVNPLVNALASVTAHPDT